MMGEIKNVKNSQIWFTDFVIAILIFTFMLIAYYTYTANISKQDSLAADDLISDAESVSSSLLLQGYPDEWDSTTVQSIGITNNNQRINQTKFGEFMEIGYNRSKKLFGTVYDYILFFVNESGDVQNVEGFCGTGNAAVNISYDITAAYYWNQEGETFLKDFMIGTFQATEYSTSGPLYFDDLIDAIKDDKYGLVVMEHPKMITDAENDAALREYVSNGGLIMLSGQVYNSQGKLNLGVEFYKHSGQSEDYMNATVLIEDKFLTFEKNKNITFTQGYYIINQLIASEDYVKIGEFVGEDAPLDEGQSAIARWTYGDGEVLFFSDFDADYLAGDFQASLEASTSKWIGAICLPINISHIDYKNLVRTDRMLIYDSNPINMVLYLWQ